MRSKILRNVLACSAVAVEESDITDADHEATKNASRQHAVADHANSQNPHRFAGISLALASVAASVWCRVGHRSISPKRWHHKTFFSSAVMSKSVDNSGRRNTTVLHTR